MSHPSNPQILFFNFAILLFTLLISPFPSPSLTNNTVTLPHASTISPDCLTNLSTSNAIALAQSTVVNPTSNRLPTYHPPPPTTKKLNHPHSILFLIVASLSPCTSLVCSTIYELHDKSLCSIALFIPSALTLPRYRS